ncbi:MAG TPA: hypothetical protein VJP86_10745 [Vicinamibacterales bacterium]|nr:hypothetical protein [Vicinamibacterales bacterium]
MKRAYLRGWSAVFVLCGGIALSDVLNAQTTRGGGAPGSAPQSAAAPASTGRRYVALGCISRDTAGSGTASAFIITDSRGDKPTVYRLDGDEKELAFHVGHTVEVKGPLRAGAPTDTGPNAKGLILRIESLTYISRTCESLK